MRPASVLLKNAASTPREFSATASNSTRPFTGRNPRKMGSHLALNPQTKGTRKPQVWRTRKLWSKPAGSSGDVPERGKVQSGSEIDQEREQQTD